MPVAVREDSLCIKVTRQRDVSMLRTVPALMLTAQSWCSAHNSNEPQGRPLLPGAAQKGLLA